MPVAAIGSRPIAGTAMDTPAMAGATIADAGKDGGDLIAMSGMARLASAIWRASRCAVQP